MLSTFLLSLSILLSIDPMVVNSPDMILVEEGRFIRGMDEGASDVRPKQLLAMDAFYLGRYEVTVAEFAKFVHATGYVTEVEESGESSGFNPRYNNNLEQVSWRDDEEGNARPESAWDHPVMHISWIDALAYCNWLSKQEGLEPVYDLKGNEPVPNWEANGYRLPTEAEWEFAASGQGDETVWAGTSVKDEVADFGNFCDRMCLVRWRMMNQNDGYAFSAPVGSFTSNALGFHDMSGNVYEWCWDWYQWDYYQSCSHNHPRGPEAGEKRVLRGGAWTSRIQGLKINARFYALPDTGSASYGFRLARSAN